MISQALNRIREYSQTIPQALNGIREYSQSIPSAGRRFIGTMDLPFTFALVASFFTAWMYVYVAEDINYSIMSGYALVALYTSSVHPVLGVLAALCFGLLISVAFVFDVQVVAVASVVFYMSRRLFNLEGWAIFVILYLTRAYTTNMLRALWTIFDVITAYVCTLGCFIATPFMGGCNGPTAMSRGTDTEAAWKEAVQYCLDPCQWSVWSLVWELDWAGPIIRAFTVYLFPAVPLVLRYAWHVVSEFVCTICYYSSELRIFPNNIAPQWVTDRMIKKARNRPLKKIDPLTAEQKAARQSRIEEDRRRIEQEQRLRGQSPGDHRRARGRNTDASTSVPPTPVNDRRHDQGLSDDEEDGQLVVAVPSDVYQRVKAQPAPYMALCLTPEGTLRDPRVMRMYESGELQMPLESHIPANADSHQSFGVPSAPPTVRPVEEVQTPADIFFAEVVAAGRRKVREAPVEEEQVRQVLPQAEVVVAAPCGPTEAVVPVQSALSPAVACPAPVVASGGIRARLAELRASYLGHTPAIAGPVVLHAVDVYPDGLPTAHLHPAEMDCEEDKPVVEVDERVPSPLMDLDVEELDPEMDLDVEEEEFPSMDLDDWDAPLPPQPEPVDVPQQVPRPAAHAPAVHVAAAAAAAPEAAPVVEHRHRAPIYFDPGMDMDEEFVADPAPGSSSPLFPPSPTPPRSPSPSKAPAAEDKVGEVVEEEDALSDLSELDAALEAEIREFLGVTPPPEAVAAMADRRSEAGSEYETAEAFMAGAVDEALEFETPLLQAFITSHGQPAGQDDSLLIRGYQPDMTDKTSRNDEQYLDADPLEVSKRDIKKPRSRAGLP
ncbi:hypothetical protein GGS20DRAFT_595376 [Poronia punctata]|nr:hypothetical protein GGS20DRAFT_595376 [Poronia punctata]